MWRVLRAHPKIVMGNEWMAAHASRLAPEHFERARFLSPRQGTDCGYDVETHPHTKDYLPLARERFDGARYVGDKIPYLYKHFDLIAERFPHAKVIFMIRDPLEVAASYKHRHNDPKDPDWGAGSVPEAIRDWNEALASIQRHYSALNPLVVHYRQFFGNGDGLGAVAQYIDLPHADFTASWAQQKYKLLSLIEKREPELTDQEVGAVLDLCDMAAYQRLLASQASRGFGIQPPFWWKEYA